MTPGPRTRGAASLNIGVCKALPKEMQDKTRELSALEVPLHARNEGQATELMHEVCAEADNAGITLVLFVAPFGDIDLSRQQLADWYARRFGFVPIQAEPILMARMPWSTPRVLNGVSQAVVEALQ